jgi:Skp family chaperone for outer membrane proteins
MNKIRISLLTLLTIGLFAGSVFAQAARPAAQTPPAGGGAAGPVPDSKVAVVNSSIFFDDKRGITKLTSAMDRVDNEFQAKDKELQAINQDIIKRTDDLQKLAASPAANPTDLQTRAETIEAMKKDLKRKLEDAQAAYTKRKLETQQPIFQDILKGLDAFAKQRGITLTLDVTKMPEAILTLVPTADITDAFISDYNSRNPATASIAKPQ